MARMRVNGIELSYLGEGSGQPILLLHGWSMSGRFFQRQMEPLVLEFVRSLAAGAGGPGA